MRLVYLGTPDDAVPPLRALADAGHDVALVVTQPDRRRSRGRGTDPSPVRRAAEELGLPVRTPERAREITDEVEAVRADLGVVVAFGQLLPVDFLAAIPNGFVNMHFSLLPRWRGAAPVERAILAGDTETGVCLMGVEAGLDTGPVYALAVVPIRPGENSGELRARLVEVGTRQLIEQLPAVLTSSPAPQVGAATYAEKLAPEEFRLDPDRPALELDRIVRAGTPRPGAWFRTGGKRVKVLRAHLVDGAGTAPGVVAGDAVLGTASGALALDEVQPEGKRPMSGVDWRRGLAGDVTAERA